MIEITKPAPEFSGITAYQRGNEKNKGEFINVSLADYRERWLILFFYPRDFTFVCPTEIKEFGKLEAQFTMCNCAVLACSTDSEWSHKNWFERDLSEVDYPVLADTTHEVSRSYQVLGADGAAQRGTFIIDPAGIVRWALVSDDFVGRSVKEVFRVLQALQTGQRCPVEWEPGHATLGT